MKIDKILYENWDDEEEENRDDVIEEDYERIKKQIQAWLSRSKLTKETEQCWVALESITHSGKNNNIQIFGPLVGKVADFDTLFAYIEQHTKGAQMESATRALHSIYSRVAGKYPTNRNDQIINFGGLTITSNNVTPCFAFPPNSTLNLKGLGVYGQIHHQNYTNTIHQLQQVCDKLIADKIEIFSELFTCNNSNRELREMIMFLHSQGFVINVVEFGARLVNFFNMEKEYTMFPALAKLGVRKVEFCKREITPFDEKIKTAIKKYFEEIVPEHGDAEYVWEDFYEEELKELLQ